VGFWFGQVSHELENSQFCATWQPLALHADPASFRAISAGPTMANGSTHSTDPTADIHAVSGYNNHALPIIGQKSVLYLLY
jgi:hypothetical protein